MTHDRDGFYLFSQSPILNSDHTYAEGDYPELTAMEEVSADMVNSLCPEFGCSSMPSMIELYISSAWDKKEKSDSSVKRKIKHK